MMKAVFVDRDGTLGGGTGVVYPKDFEPFDNALNSIEILKNNGYSVIAFSNQPDVALGKILQKEFEDELFGFGFDDVCICPHQPSDCCICRKPSTHMLEKMVDKYGLDKPDCYVIGDRWTDMLAGINAGMNVILVTTGCGNEALNQYADKWDVKKASYIASDISDAIHWIIAIK